MHKPASLRVAVVVGSDSDIPALEPCLETLRELGQAHELRVISAHRTPEAAREFALGAEREGFGVIIAAAGGAAHLAGVLASHTTRPVIGVLVQGGALSGVDALLSTVQMPGGVPVAAVAVGKGGAVNAAVLAAEILALSDRALAARLVAYRMELAEKVKARDAELRRRWPD